MLFKKIKIIKDLYWKLVDYLVIYYPREFRLSISSLPLLITVTTTTQVFHFEWISIQDDLDSIFAAHSPLDNMPSVSEDQNPNQDNLNSPPTPRTGETEIPNSTTESQIVLESSSTIDDLSPKNEK